MRDHFCVRKWKNGSLVEWKRRFVVILLVKLVAGSENHNHVPTPMDESIEIEPLGDMEDNQDRTKMAGPQYDASLDKTVYITTSTENPGDSAAFHGTEKSEEFETTSRPQLNDNSENNKDWETVNTARSETKENEGQRNEYNEKPKIQMGYLDDMLKHYDKRAWPTYGTKEPTVVLVNMYINSIGSISAADMDYNMDIYLRQSWVDPRLALNAFGVKKPIFLSGENIISSIWRPDLYFRNVKEAKFPAISNPNMLIKIGLHGEILFSTRLALKLSCQMSFQNYPLDKQECHIIMGSSSYTANILRLNWMKRAVLLDHHMEIPDYYLTKVSKSCPYFRSFIVTDDSYITDQLLYKWDEIIPPDCVWEFLDSPPVEFKIVGYTRDSLSVYFPTTGTFSYLNATFTIKRQNGYHLVNTYLPITLIVMISWVSFFLNVDASPARTTLGVTTLLALTTVAAGIRRQLPPVSYIKAVDVWIGACSIMVFGALIEFAIVNFLSRCQRKVVNWKPFLNLTQWVKKLESKIYPLSTIQAEQCENNRSETPKDQNMKFARKVDRFARFSFPSVFFIFNVVYWFYYLYLAQ